MAEGILRAQAIKHDLAIFVDSAGTSDYHRGENPDKRAIETMHKHGIDISALKSRPFTANDFEAFDLIYCMDASNYAEVLKLAKGKAQEEKVKLIRNVSIANSNRQVPDPYFGANDGFEEVYKILSDECQCICNNLKHEQN